MKKIIIILFSLGFVFSGCTPSSEQLKKAIKKDPSIVYVAIEQDPEKFIEVMNKAARLAQAKKATKILEADKLKREEQFKTPLQPVIEKDRASFGTANAPITIVAYYDFESIQCGRGHKVVQEVMKSYPNRVTYIVKHMPTEARNWSFLSAQYYEAIARQNSAKAFSYASQVLDSQDQLRAKGVEHLKQIANGLGLDMNKLKQDLQDMNIVNRIRADSLEASRLGFTGTPGFLVNGVAIKGPYPASEFKAIIDRHLAANK